MTALRFQTGGRHQTPPASLRGRHDRTRQEKIGQDKTQQGMAR